MMYYGILWLYIYDDIIVSVPWIIAHTTITIYVILYTYTVYMLSITRFDVLLFIEFDVFTMHHRFLVSARPD